MKHVDYDARLHALYSSGARMSPEKMAGWISAFAARLPAHRPLTLADVGSGTGRIAPSLAEEFKGHVYGIEPSDRMRAVAEREASHARVTYEGGRAESMPLGGDSVDGALLFGVWHHVERKALAAQELSRVVRRDGRLLIRTTSRDRLPELWWYRHFPRAREIDVAMAAPLASTLSTLAGAGWELSALDEVTATRGPARCEDDFAQLQGRAMSTFEHLSEDEIREGLANIAAALARNPGQTVLPLPMDLLVFTHAPNSQQVSARRGRAVRMTVNGGP